MQAVIIYYGGIIIAAILAGISQRIKSEDRKLAKNAFWFFSMLVLLLIFGFREIGVGVDDHNYNIIFQQTAKIGVINEFLATTMEPGYLLLNYIISMFTDNFQVVIFITTLIPIFLYYKALEYEKDKISMFWAVFLMGTILFIYFCGITRLFIASSIIAYGLRFIIEKKPVKYLIILLLATSFHYSAFFMLFLLYFTLEKKEKKKSTFKLILLISIIMPVVIIAVSQYILPNMGDRYSSYTTMKNNAITLDIFDKVPFLILAFYFRKEMEKKIPNIRIYITIFAMSVIIAIYSTVMEIDRIQWYCMFSICIILPSIYEVLKKIKKQEFAIMYMPIMIVYPILYSYIILNSQTRQSMLFYQNILTMIN